MGNSSTGGGGGGGGPEIKIGGKTEGIDRSSGEKPRRIPGVSACLNQGVLPRQHKHIKQVISMLANQSNLVNADELETINTSLIKEASNVNAIHERLKQNA